MVDTGLPRDFRWKVQSYLGYVLENKKIYKLEEEDVLSMLNDNLKIELLVHMNG